MVVLLFEKGVELECIFGFFQFNRDVDDEEVRMFRFGLYGGGIGIGVWYVRMS